MELEEREKADRKRKGPRAGTPKVIAYYILAWNIAIFCAIKTTLN